jgi:Protein of unknown function (DUF3102)
MTEITQQAFDYGQLDGESWKFVQDARDEIRRLGEQTVQNLIEIGRWLTEVKERLPWGQWGTWLTTECRMSETTARRCMERYALAKSATVEELDIILSLPPTVAADIAAPTVPDSARQEVLERAAGGEKMTRQKFKETSARHRGIDGDRRLGKREQKLRQNLGDERAERFQQTHPELNEPAGLGVWLRTAPVEGVVNAIFEAVDGARFNEIVTQLMDKIGAASPEPALEQPPANGAVPEPAAPQPELAEETADAVPEAAPTGNGVEPEPETDELSDELAATNGVDQPDDPDADRRARIRAEKERRGTQKALADALGLTQGTISNVLTPGRTITPEFWNKFTALVAADSEFPEQESCAVGSGSSGYGRHCAVPGRLEV